MVYKHTKSRGFTLLEIMLALSIVSLALLTVISSFSLIVRSKATTSNYTRAAFLLEEKLHDLKTEGFKRHSQEGVFESPFERFSWDTEWEMIPRLGLRKVLISVFWKEGNRSKELQITTYLREES